MLPLPVFLNGRREEQGLAERAVSDASFVLESARLIGAEVPLRESVSLTLSVCPPPTASTAVSPLR